MFFLISLLVFLPGYLISRIFKKDILETAALTFALAFLFYGVWIELPFIKFNLTIWFALVSLLAFVSIALKKPSFYFVKPDLWTKIALAVILISAAQKFFVSYDLFFPPGEDISHHLYRAQLIYLNQKRPTDSLPYFDFKSFNYPSASHTLLAAYRLFNYPIEKAMLYLGIFSHVFLALSVFIFINEIFKNSKISAFAVFLICFTSLGLHEYFLWGAFPALVSWPIVILCFYYTLKHKEIQQPNSLRAQFSSLFLTLQKPELIFCLASSALTHSFSGIVSVLFLLSVLLTDLKNWKKYLYVLFFFIVLILPQIYFTLLDYLEFLPANQEREFPTPYGEIPVSKAISLMLSRPSNYSFFSFLIPFSTMLWLLFIIGILDFHKIKEKFSLILYFVFICSLLLTEKIGFSGWQFILPTRFLESLFIVYIVIYCSGIRFFIEKKFTVPLVVFLFLFLIEVPYSYNNSVWSRQRQEQWALLNKDDMKAIDFIKGLNETLIVTEPRAAGQMIPYFTGKKIFYFYYYDSCFALKQGNCFVDYEQRKILLNRINDINESDLELYKSYNATVFFKAHSVFPIEKNELMSIEFNKTYLAEKGFKEIFNSGNSSVLKIS